MDTEAFQTFSTRPTKLSGRRAFTLVELIVGATISGFILVGVLASFLHLGRIGANIQNYTEIEAKARKSLELFSREVRLAYKINTAFNATSFTLSIPDATANLNDTPLYTVTYTFDSANKRLSRIGPPADDPTGAVATTHLVENIQQVPGKDPFNYYRVITGAGYVDGFNTTNVATPGHPLEVKQIEINFLLTRKSSTVVAASNKVLSARFICRNK